MVESADKPRKTIFKKEYHYDIFQPCESKFKLRELIRSACAITVLSIEEVRLLYYYIVSEIFIRGRPKLTILELISSS